MIGRLTILQLVSALTFSLISHELNDIFLFVPTFLFYKDLSVSLVIYMRNASLNRRSASYARQG